jgi:Immunity protein Imm6
MANDADFLDRPAFLEAVTIRARAAYYLAVAESVFAAIPPTDEGLNYARAAINMAWQWVAGTPIEADDLYLCLENEDGTGLVVFTYRAKNERKRGAAWEVVYTAIMYVIWQAYQAEGAKYVPQTIEAADETMVVDLHRYAEDTGEFDHQVARRLLKYLQANYPASKADELGSPISRGDVTATMEA